MPKLYCLDFFHLNDGKVYKLYFTADLEYGEFGVNHNPIRPSGYEVHKSTDYPDFKSFIDAWKSVRYEAKEFMIC